MSTRGGDEAPVKDAAIVQELSGAVVHGLYRVVKACQFHTDVSNDAVTSLTSSATNAVAEYCSKANVEQVAVSFLGDAIFVNRQILKASRDTHALAAELRELLEVCGVTELTLQRSVDRSSISVFAKLLADVQRDRSLVSRIVGQPVAGITAGKAMFAASGASREESPGQRAARTYATSVLTVQSVLGDVRLGKFELPRRVKRVAQQVVARADEDARMLVALAATGGVSMDAATVAVGSAILAVAMARQLTSDRAVLANAAMTALLYDAGRVLLAFNGDGPQRVLNDDELDRVPARTVAALTSLGRMHAPARARTALLYEVWSMRRAHRLGAVYRGRRPPTLLARIIGVARAFAELRGAGAGGALSVDDALQMLGSRAADGTERALVKLLVGALGIYPAGTMVTLNTGELAVVMGTPDKPVDYVRPPVKVLYDAYANLLETPFDVDLARLGTGDTMRFIARAVDADDQQMKAMRAFVVKAQAEKRRGAIEMDLLARPIPEPTLQSVRDDDAVGVTKRPPVAVIDATSSTAPPGALEDVSPAPWRVPDLGEHTPRSASLLVPDSAPEDIRTDRPRRRDPRTDSTPPSSLTEDVRARDRTTKPHRNNDPPPPRVVMPEGHDAETVRPPSSADPSLHPLSPASPLDDEDLSQLPQLEEIGPPTLPPRPDDVLTTAPPAPLELIEVTSTSPPELIELGGGTSAPPHLDTLPPLGDLGPLDELPRFDDPELDSLFSEIEGATAGPTESVTRQTAPSPVDDEHNRPTAPPPPSATKEKESQRDAMLAAFLADAPLGGTEPPPKTGDDRRTPVVPRKKR